MDKKHNILMILLVLAALLCGCADPDEGNISFEDMDFSNVRSVLLVNLHNGGQTYIDDTQRVTEICDYLKNIRGEDGTSAKGYYEGSYGVALYANTSASLAVMEEEAPILSVGFGDTSSFYYGILEDGQPTRYAMTNTIIEEVISFLRQYDQFDIS